MQPRIYVDFNTMMMDAEARVYIGNEGSEQEGRDLLRSLRAGAPITLYDEELEVEGVIEIVTASTGERIWLGKPDWSTRRDLLPAALSAAQQM